MTKSIQQIKQELDNIESAVAETSEELLEQYRNYVELLSQSVKQQLISAGYQICTQFYPQSFLDLSLSNKQDLQQALRQTSIEIQPALLAIIQERELEPEPNELNLMAKLIENLPKAKKRTKTKQEPKAEDSDSEDSVEEINLESVKAELGKLENIEFIEIDAAIDDDSERSFLETALPDPPKQQVDFKNPEHLILWYKQTERKIKKTLDDTSRKANKFLQKSKIIPDRIPNQIIDVAMQTDVGKSGKNSRNPNTPNILHLTIESDSDKKSKTPKKTANISLLRLRLAEIEFIDPILNAKRGQIRNLMGKISKLNSKYKAVQHQIAIAEARAAWRSSWYED